MCGDKRQYYAYDEELYTSTFPHEWVKTHSVDGTGPSKCKNCNIFGSWNGVFIGYCMNCAEYVYNFERGKGFGIMGIENPNKGKGTSVFNSYLKNIQLEDIGDVDFMNSMNVIDIYLENHVRLYFEDSEYRDTMCTIENGKQTITMGINYSEILYKIFHIAEEYVITFDKVFNKITFYQDTMTILEDQIDAISDRGLDLINEKNTAALKQRQEQEEEKEMEILYQIYSSEEMDKYMRGIDIGGYSMVVPTKILTFEEFKIKTFH